jgi:hypothetical protein
MSTAVRRPIPPPLAGACVAFLFASAAAAQAPRGSDLLEQYRDRNAVAVQQLENEIRDIIVQAQRLAATDPAKAAEQLKRALARVEDDKVLTATRRESLVRDLKERIRVAQADTRRADLARTEKVEQTINAADRQTAAQREAAEQERIHEALNNVRSLRRDGKNEEANRLARELATRYPENLAVQVAAQVGDTADRVNEAREMRRETERRRLLVFQDVDRSAMLPIGDIEFPKDWAAKTKMRKAVQNPLTAKERAILEALNRPITLDLKDVKLYEMIDQLQNLLGQPIITDDEALKAANVSEDSMVSARARRPTAARSVLRQVLGPLDLTYVVKDQSIYITTKEKAKQMMTVRTYYLGDMLGTFSPFLPPVANQMQMAQNVAYMVDLIKRTVDPDSWADNGRDGLGTIAFDPITMSLVVRQSAEVHYLISSGLR